MSKAPQRMRFDDFALHLQHIFDAMAKHKQPVIVEREGQLYRVEPEEWQPQDIWANYDPVKAQDALRKSAGALTHIDRQAFLAELREQREQDSHGRPA